MPKSAGGALHGKVKLVGFILDRGQAAGDADSGGYLQFDRGLVLRVLQTATIEGRIAFAAQFFGGTVGR